MTQYHFYAFTFYETNGPASTHASSYAGHLSQYVSLKDIADAKQAAKVSQAAVLISCAYMGFMTKEQFYNE